VSAISSTYNLFSNILASHVKIKWYCITTGI